MDSQIPIRGRFREAPLSYRLMRAVIRLGFWLFSPGLRVINQERLAQPGPAILLIAHPRGFLVALLLIGALDRQVYCLMPSGRFRGIFRKLAGWAFEIKAFDYTTEEQESLLDPCVKVLGNHGVIALFAGENLQDGIHRTSVAGFGARLAVEGILRSQIPVRPVLDPLHWFLGSGRRSRKHLMCIGSPIHAHQFLPKVGEDLDDASLHLIEAVQNAMDTNAFGLADPEVEYFDWELENLSREQLQREWSGQANWKQRPEEFHLSGFVRKWIVGQNRSDPARLVELRELLHGYREARRRHSMGQLIVESSGPWHASRFRMAAAWCETIFGLSVALYGLVNHLPAIIVLAISGLFKHSPSKEPRVEWLQRTFIVLSAYSLQIFLVNFWWGRAAAGYYALTLPVSGAYVWRYRWLLRNRVHVLLLKALGPFRSARLNLRREKILGRIDRELEQAAHSFAMPGMPSSDPTE